MRGSPIILSVIISYGFILSTSCENVKKNYSARKLDTQSINVTTEYVNETIPIMVSIQLRKPSGVYVHLCGGIIITEQFVLTAAHCFIKSRKDPKLFRIVAGTELLYNKTTMQPFQVKALVVHEYFLPLHGSDIALIQVNGKFPLGEDKEHFKNVSYKEDRKPGGLDTVLFGWGSADDPTKERRLEVMHFNTMETQNCWDRGYMFVTGSDICAMHKKGRGACGGDSGGPLMSPDHKVFFGLLSYTKRSCALDMPYVFTRISRFGTWIDNSIARLLLAEEQKKNASLLPKSVPKLRTGVWRKG